MKYGVHVEDWGDEWLTPFDTLEEAKADFKRMTEDDLWSGCRVTLVEVLEEKQNVRKSGE